MANEELFKRISEHAVDSETIVAAKVRGEKFVNLEWIRKILGVKKEEASTDA